MDNIRVRFAPSPTGALHIGGIRTALYNYLLTKKYNGTFILRIEDTDQTRYVEGAEEYIKEALEWCGIMPTEGPGIGGDYGPYRQSERKELYQKYGMELLKRGHAYYAFDTAEELDAWREKLKTEGNHVAKYDSSSRMEMRNSLTLSESEVKTLLDNNTPYTIRLKIPKGEVIAIHDLVRGKVEFKSDELDDKIILKGDGMPTYHLANIVDDHYMKITHVIRGEEWLPSTAHHVYMYRFLDWEDTMPQFSHLPLILKPNGKGKLSKRDGKKFGFPVFPLSWNAETEEDSFIGFREMGFDPKAMLNFLVFLGWNPGTEQEIFSLAELAEAFSIERINKAGARFDFDKATWFNQQYLLATDDAVLAKQLQPYIEGMNYDVSDDFLTGFVALMKERVNFLAEFVNKGYYFFEPVKEYDQKTIRKRWKPERQDKFELLKTNINNISNFEAVEVERTVKSFMEAEGLGFGDVLPILRVGLSGTMKGPDVFKMIALLGKEEVLRRLDKAYELFNEILTQNNVS